MVFSRRVLPRTSWRPRRVRLALGFAWLPMLGFSLSLEAQAYPATTKEATSPPPDPPVEIRHFEVWTQPATIERSFAGHETHHQPLRLQPGDWTVEVEQLGIDVVVEAPAEPTAQVGKPHERVRVDNPFDGQGRELLVLGGTSSPVEVVITPRDRQAAAGHYTLRLRRTDPTRRAALRATQRSALAYAKTRAHTPATGVVEALETGIEALTSALTEYRALGDRLGEAESLHQRALLRRHLDDRTAAETDLRDALALWQDLDNPSFEATARNDLGLLLEERGASDAGLALIQQAEALYRRLGDRRNAAIVGVNVCLAAHRRGTLDQARPCYEALLEPFRHWGARRPLANVLNSLGGLAYQEGDPARARHRFGEALALHRELGDREGQAAVLNNRASLLRYVGAWREALADHGRALDLQRLTGDLRGEARSLNNLGYAYLQLGELERARSHFEEALPLRDRVGDRAGQATTLSNLGTVYQRLDNPAKALAFHQQALELRQALGRPRDVARTQLWLARDLQRLGRNDEAARRLDQALERFTTVEDRRYQAIALADRGRRGLVSGNLVAARHDLEAALDLQLEVGDRWSEVETRVALAEVAQRAGDPHQAFALAQEALRGVEGLGRGVGIPTLQASFLAARQQAVELALTLALELDALEPGSGHAHTAFALSERMRGRALLTLLERAGVDPDTAPAPSTDPAHRQRLRNVEEQLRLLATRRLRAASRRQTATVETLDRQLGRLAAEADRLEAALWPDDLRSKAPQPLEIGEVQALLEPDTLLVEVALASPQSVVWIVTRDHVAWVRLPDRATLETAARQAHQALATLELVAPDPIAGQQAEAEASDPALVALTEMLLAPWSGALAAGALAAEANSPQRRRLLFVPAGALHAVPLAALPLPQGLGAPGQRVVDRFEVAHLPSASVLAALRRPEPRPRKPRWQVAVLADPIFTADDLRLATGTQPTRRTEGEDRSLADRVTGRAWPRLAGSRREAEAIAALTGPDRVWSALDAKAGRHALRGSEVASARIVHVATHGQIDGEHPEASGLVLSRFDDQGRPVDGFLGLREIYQLRLAADTVVLSGCRTAQGRTVQGEGWIGLGHGFFHAGARRVVASLWQVDDAATAVLMEHFYRGLLVEADRPAAALRKAQQALRAQPRYADPYYWAGFVLQGDG